MCILHSVDFDKKKMLNRNMAHAQLRGCNFRISVMEMMLMAVIK